MKIYNNKTVANYIMGNDLDGFDVDELEDNVDFMIDVMRMSSDKEMYHFCSDNVKSNPEFVSFIISHFNNDADFITKVADEFLSKCEDDVDRIEIFIMMTKNLRKDHPKYLEYAVMVFGLQLEKDTLISASKDLYKDDPEHLSCIGETGFSLLFDEYKQSRIVTNYFAEKCLEKLLHTDSCEFEDLFHRLFKSLDELNSVGMKSYLIDYISNYDSELATYVSSHLEVLEGTLKEIALLKSKWDTYSKRIEAKKYRLMFEQVHRYVEENGNNSAYTEDELLYSIGNELGIIKEIYRNDSSMPAEADVPYEEALPDTARFDNGVILYDDLSLYNSLREIISKFAGAKTFKELEDLENEYSESADGEKEIDGMLDEIDSDSEKNDNKSGSNIIDFRNAIRK